MTQLKHLLRYISGTKDYAIQLQPKAPQATQQGLLPTTISTFSDSDWAGCIATRKSTSGFMITLFNIPISWASRTQSTIATSSAEAELYAIGSSVAESIFIKQILEEINNPSFDNVHIDINVMTDSSAGKSMATRQGISKKGKHIMMRYLFVQDLVASGAIKLCKVSTVNNLADIFTKYVPSAVLHHLLPLCGVKPSGSSGSVSFSVNSVHFASSSRLPTTPRRIARSSRTSADRLEGGNNSNNNNSNNLPSPWIAARSRSSSASSIVPATWSTAPATAAAREF
eukprot:6490844-Amphidinium_carterae.2